MSTRLFTSFVIIFLLAGCVFMLVRFRKLQQHNNLQVSGIFVPNKGVPAVTVKYLEAVKKLF